MIKKRVKTDFLTFPVTPGLIVTIIVALLCLPVQADSQPDTPRELILVQLPLTTSAGKILRLSLLTGQAVSLTDDFYSAADPAVSFDGKSIFFSGKRREKDLRQIWRMDSDGRNKVQLTTHAGDCFAPLSVGTLFHLDDNAPVSRLLYLAYPESALYTCNMDGSDSRRITFGSYPARNPSVLPNGRVVYSTFVPGSAKGSAKGSTDKIGTNGNYQLLAVNIDGTDLMGFQTADCAPGDKESARFAADGRIYLIVTQTNHYLGGGSLGYVSQRRPYRSYNELNNSGIFRDPCPLPDGSMVISFRGKNEHDPFALHLLDTATGKPGKKCFALPGNHIIDAQVLAPHAQVNGRSSFNDPNRDDGVLYCISVYLSSQPKLQNLPQGSVKTVRVFAGEVFENKNGDRQINEELLKNGDRPGNGPGNEELLGSAPVEADGSFHIRVPAQRPLWFQLLDKNDAPLGRRSGETWVMPRESRGCIGCHQNRELAPPNQLPQAVLKPAVNLVPVHNKK